MRLTAAAVLALLLAAPASAQTVAEPTAVCGTSEREFLASAERMKAKVLVASQKAREAIMGEINNARLSAKLWAFEADKLSIGVIMDEGRLLVGIVMFEGGCVVPGSVKVVQAEAFIAFITGLGLSMDDFKPESDA